MDQLGAFLGPVILFVLSLVKGVDSRMDTYRLCFAVLGIPALATMAVLTFAKMRYPHPEEFTRQPQTTERFALKSSFLLYMAAICFFAFGFADFTLITMHIARIGAFPAQSFSLLYALAMAVDAFAALFFGWLFDRVGVRALMLSTVLSVGFSALVFLSGSAPFILLGIVLWGIGMGAQESIMKAAVSEMIPASMRSTGFGIFETGFGIAWFFGSWILGALYDRSLRMLVLVSTAAQLCAIIFYQLCLRAQSTNGGKHAEE